jgi:hypothetical protein
LTSEKKLTIVSNTFTTEKEINPYLNTAKYLGYDAFVVKCDGGFDNIHGVPTEVLDKMRGRWVDVPDEMSIEQFDKFLESI